MDRFIAELALAFTKLPAPVKYAVVVLIVAAVEAVTGFQLDVAVEDTATSAVEVTGF